ncbi:MAG TPA: glycosyltransferase [Candidatus Omnitrophota bacterium]|nr:glycosyltransferase [Candidatus Omnitrophota bacterium]
MKVSPRNAKKICIITSSYLSCSPRTVKEADALSAAGYDVRVVFSQGNIAYVRAFDEGFLAQKLWRWSVVGWAPFIRGQWWRYYLSRVRLHICNSMSWLWFVPGIAERAQGRMYPELCRLAAAERADLYIGHYPEGLSVAARASARWHVPFAYDVEDLYSVEFSNDKVGRKASARIKLLEKRYVSKAAYISVVSSGVGKEMAARYVLPEPVVIRNVFAWSERSLVDGKLKDKHGQGLSVYWYSQVIGEDRGIQDVIRALALVKGEIQLHLRGYLSPSIKERFISLARECGVLQMVYFHDPVPPQELLSRTMEHDIGLAIEQPLSLSRTLTISNKFFYYMLAGLAVIATDTPGQADCIRQYPGVGLLYRSGDYRALAMILQGFIDDPKLLVLYKDAALDVCQTQWNWEKESRKLCDQVATVLQ